MEKNIQMHAGKKLIRVLMFTLVISSMSVLMFNFVLPEISKEFELTTSQVSWVTSSYSLIYGIGTVIYGKLADRFQLKNLLTIGLLFFAFGSLIGLASNTFWMVLVARCLQSVGAAAIPATAMLIPLRYFPPEQRGSAMGTVFVGLAIGSALGPVISALIVSVANWRWLFCIPLFSLLTLPFYRQYLQNEEGQRSGQFDWIGGILLATTITFLLLGITNESWLFSIFGLLALVLFLIRIRSVSEPFVQPELFKNNNYTLGLLIAFLISGIGFSLQFLSPLLLAQVQQLQPGWVGFAMVPAAVASAVLGRMGGKLADFRGNSYLFFVASGLLLACFILLSTFTGVSPVLIAIFLIFGNVGQTFIMIALSNSVSITLKKEQQGVGMGLFSMVNFIAGGVASGVYGKLVDLGSNVLWNPLNVTPNGSIYSNIYLVLIALLIGILLFSYFQLARSKEKSKIKI
ncbi:MFS transporter [Bacillus sp. FJAT-49705]|uniref:MFS transporter n=1 Tax=Cytobacillus citreus TaxID=2833586 RepID=A0ABS5NYS1_9BACI|nr:MFS transporter [Cytobacillus citreus]MBS4193000.1 MFS transporter [Cytobacillus citreus]